MGERACETAGQQDKCSGCLKREKKESFFSKDDDEVLDTFFIFVIFFNLL